MPPTATATDTPTIGELLDLPAQVFRGDFVLNLSDGVTRPQETLERYVVTPQLVDCFDEALKFIGQALETNKSKAAYLHGSFGAGKSHFMAVLHLLLQNNPDARGINELAGVMVKHPWTAGKKFLLVPYHLIGARNLETAILGGYAEHVRRHHPGAELPGVFVADDIFKNAEELRGHLGDEKFFALLNQTTGPSKWKGLAKGWTAESYRLAVAAPPGDETRARLVGTLVQHLLTSYRGVADAKDEAYVDLDQGLSVISRHAQAIGYDAVILFLDELILWLASNAADLAFVQREGQKLAKLAEFKNPRAIPLVSFVARQRDLRDLVGDRFTGAEQLNFAEILKHWEGRFHTIKLEDRNLPAIAERRVLRAKNADAKARLDAAFTQTMDRLKGATATVMTTDADRNMFRQTYPFTPAFVQTLVAVSSALQRERTALKIMLELLVNNRDKLRLGDLVPVGDLWDAVAGGEEAFSDVLLNKVRNARKLYQQRLRPMLEEDPQNLAANDRIVKTLLLADLCPEVPALKDLTPAKLAYLNWGSIQSPLPGREGNTVRGRLIDWSARCGEIHLSDSGANPVVTLRVSGVDTDGIIQKGAGVFDNVGNRCRKVRELLFEGIRAPGDELFTRHVFTWRGTQRGCSLLLAVVRELNDETVRCGDDEWKVILTWPFDPDHRERSEAVGRVERFRSTQKETRTIAWVPAFLSRKAQDDLGKLVTIDHLLRGDQLDQYSQHLSVQDRATARGNLDSQRNALTNGLRLTLEAAYGFREGAPAGMVDADASDPRVFSLWPSVTLRPPVGAAFRDALENLVGQALEQQFPAHPSFEREVKVADVRKVLEVLQRAVQSGEPRVFVDRRDVGVVRQIAEPLELGKMGDTHFVPGERWRKHFDKHLATSGKPTPSVSDLREWIDRPQPMGLPDELENLLVLAYAFQTNRSFVRAGGPVEPTLDRLPGDLDLRPEDLPRADEWDAAKQRAAVLFGVTMTGPLTGTNVRSLAKDVQQKAEAVRGEAQRLPDELTAAATRLGVPAVDLQQSARFRTAAAALLLVQAVNRREATAAVQQLTLARLETSAPAMARSLVSAAEVLAAVRDAPWPLLALVGQIDDHRRPAAQQTLEAVRRALLADEYVTGLRAALDDVQQEAFRLLALAPASPPATPVSPPPLLPPIVQPPPGVKLIDRGHEGGLDAEGWRKFAEEIASRLAADGRLRLEVGWTLREEAGS